MKFITFYYFFFVLGTYNNILDADYSLQSPFSIF